MCMLLRECVNLLRDYSKDRQCSENPPANIRIVFFSAIELHDYENHEMTVSIIINHIKCGIGNDKIVLVLIILLVFVVKNPIAKHEQMSDNHYVYRTTDSIITVNI